MTGPLSTVEPPAASRASHSVERPCSASYRLLQPGEVIDAGDEYLEDDCQTWTQVPIGGGRAVWQCWMIGKKQNPNMMQPFRRPTPNNALAKPHENLPQA